MKKIIKIICIISVIAFTGCENEEILTADSDYKEYIVVQAQIEANKFFPSVRFTKTLPLGVPYTIEDSELTSVIAYIRRNGVQIISLVYSSEGLYKPLSNIFVVEGETYELFAMYGGTYIYSKTIIPYKPEIERTFYDSNRHRLNAEVKAKIGEVYAAVWSISTTPAVIAKDYYSISSGEAGSSTTIATSSLPEVYRSNIYSNSRYIRVDAFDETFKEYFNSRTSGNEINDPFVQGGGEIIWNVQGNNTIGLFIGIAKGIPQQVF